MRFQPALVAATTLLGASAFLVPAEVSDAVVDAKESLNRLVMGKHDIDVYCHECNFWFEKTSSGWGGIDAPGYRGEGGIKNSVHLEFSTDESGLKVNNATIYPLDSVNNEFPRIKAHQVRTDNGEKGVEVPVDFAVEVEPLVKDGLWGDLMSVKFTVLGLLDLPERVQTAKVHLIHDRRGGYSIPKVEAIDKDFSQPDGCEGSTRPSLCRVRAMIMSQIRKMVESSKSKAHGVKDWMKHKAPAPGNKARPHGRPCHDKGTQHKNGKPAHPKGHHHSPHSKHQGGHRHMSHKCARILGFIFGTLVFPALVGIILGLTVCAIGSVVGRLVAFCWMKFGRGGQRGPLNNIRVIEISDDDCEKEGLLVVEEDMPPQYEDVEAQKVEVKDKQEGKE